MEKLPNSFYKKSLAIGILLFLVVWGIMLVKYNLLEPKPQFSIIYLGLLALLCSGLFMLSIVCFFKILSPALIQDSSEESLRVYKKRHMSLKLILLSVCSFTTFFIFLRLISGISILSPWRALYITFSGSSANPFLYDPSFWLDPLAGLITGFITGLFAVGIVRWIIKNYEKDDGKNRLSFRNS